MAPRDGGGEGSSARLALAAIVRNEGPYLLEWIAHHRALGIGRFYIADNDSSDETTATLAALARAGIVRHLPFASVPGVPPQQSAYVEILRRFGAEAEWIAFVDADEFLVPASPHRTLAAALAPLTADPGVGAIVVNWAIYGSSGARAADGRPVAGRFRRRAVRACPYNRHYKSIVRPEAVVPRIERNPHHFSLHPGFRTVHADGGVVEDLPDRPRGLSAGIVWTPLRINHYVIKSWDEFHYRKRLRGRATGPEGLPRDTAFFHSQDRNEVLDPMPARLLRAAAAEAGRIEARLRATATVPAATSGWRAGAVEAIEIHSGEIHGNGTPGNETLGNETHGVALVRGWALTGQGAPAQAFAVNLGGRPVPVSGLVRSRRCDIVARHPAAAFACGFAFRIAWLPGLAPADLVVTALDAAGHETPLAVTALQPEFA